MAEKMTATPMMAAVGLDWSGVQAFAEKSIRLLQQHGPEFLDLLDAGFKAFSAITNHNFVAIFTELNRATVDVNKLIAAIKEEFNIE